MNFLAHLYLSGNNEELMVGNFIGDFVKGKQHDDFDEGIKRGILLHRHIDQYTDSHEVVSESKKRLWDKYRHYAGVIVDMFYDHFLAVNWTNYHSLPLAEYAAHVYKTMLSHKDQLPEGANYMLPFMIEHNWLLNYSKREGINSALTGMAKRTSFKSGMENAVNDLNLYYNDFENEFLRFFPELQNYVKGWLEKN